MLFRSAKALSISDNTVRVLKARALKKLRDAGIQPDGTFESVSETANKAA